MTKYTEVVHDDSLTGQPNRIGPGARLRLAREKTNLSINDVATRLHLRSQLISDLENDDYSQLPQFVFVRGYLRAYATLLNISADEVIAEFAALNIEETPSDRPVWHLQKKQVTSKDRPMRWATYLIILCLLTLVGIWWHSQKNMLQNKNKADGALPFVMENLKHSAQSALKVIDKPLPPATATNNTVGATTNASTTAAIPGAVNSAATTSNAANTVNNAQTVGNADTTNNVKTDDNTDAANNSSATDNADNTDNAAAEENASTETHRKIKRRQRGEFSAKDINKSINNE